MNKTEVNHPNVISRKSTKNLNVGRVGNIAHFVDYKNSDVVRRRSASFDMPKRNIADRLSENVNSITVANDNFQNEKVFIEWMRQWDGILNDIPVNYIEESGDTIRHAAEAIISNEFKIGDEKIFSKSIKNPDFKKANEVLNSDVEEESDDKIRDLYLGKLAKKIFSNTETNTENMKRTIARMLAKKCQRTYRDYKTDIQQYISKLETSLEAYLNDQTPKNANEVILAQERLFSEVNSLDCDECIKDVLIPIFVREAVHKFYTNEKNFGDLKSASTIRKMQQFFNGMYENLAKYKTSSSDCRIEECNFFKLGEAELNKAKKDKFDIINSIEEEYLSDLTYGFGFYPFSLDLDIKKLSLLKDMRKSEGLAHVILDVLCGSSLTYPLTSKDGKKFTIADTGSTSDRNCAFRGINILGGKVANGYMDTQKCAIDGMKKISSEWSGYSQKTKNGIRHLLEGSPALSDKGEKIIKKDINKVPNYLNGYAKTCKNGYVTGMDGIDYLVTAVGLGVPICEIDEEMDRERTYYPDGTYRDNEKTHDDKTVYIASIDGHAMGALKLDKSESSTFVIADDKKEKIKELIKQSIYWSFLRDEVLHGYNEYPIKSIGKYASEGKHWSFKFFKYAKDCNDLNDDEKKIFKILFEANYKTTEDEDKELARYFRIINDYVTAKIAKKNGSTIDDKELKAMKGAAEKALESCLEILVNRMIKICEENPLYWLNVKQEWNA